MKKLLLLISSLFLLGGCATSEANPTEVIKEETVSVTETKRVLRYENNLPVVRSGSSSFKTYLLLSPFGTIDIAGSPVKGEVSELFYENCVVWEADPGTDLPGVGEVKSSVKDATFRGWAYYDEDNDHVFPDYYTKVPVKEGLALKAIFDGPEGGGGSDPSSLTKYTITNFADWVPNDGAAVFVWTWGGDSGNGAWTPVTLSYQGENNNFHNVSGTFSAPSNIIGFNIARCSAGTTLPDWNATGNSSGRVYNKTADVSVTYGVTSFTAPEFVEYNPY